MKALRDKVSSKFKMIAHVSREMFILVVATAATM